MIGSYRSHLVIQMEILEMIATSRLTPYLSTQIMYRVSLSSGQIMKYLREMQKDGLLTIEPIAHRRVAKNEYKITESGRVLLNLWTQFEKTWELLVKPIHEAKLHSNHT